MSFRNLLTANDRIGTHLLTEPNALPLGATYIPDFVSSAVEVSLVRQIDAVPWITELKRRVQHYGYGYDYRARTVTDDAYLGPLPDWLMGLGARLKDLGWFKRIPDQVIVNEYEPGQGIAAHIDCVPCFAGTIASLSLLSACTMRFEEQSSGEQLTHILEPRSLLLLQGPARFDWNHAIPARKSDVIEGQRVPRGRRLSLTFRNVVMA
ncbi:MAG: alpha-ketoglutarate-dependent dioxygenase AlkB [Roseitalea sp.]|nr:alpha-ketoglutarate-dependent dioxygenase AlkB [Roseitalea sp.]MBO6721635.1 alpha-ketoglutarate-dependent dioxygenase AlkB [Roseitalea sp.]MBO6743391.1 alpha-ketoglutarate-dependent dioxygenase AlkB [Roseitalea sp.]